MPISPPDILACILAVVLCKWLYFRRARGNVPHPSGPPGLPLVGNLLDMPKNPAWSTYIHWSEKYGSGLVRLNVLGNNIVVVNTLEAATDLLEKRSANYSDRPEMIMLNELCGYGWGLAFRRYGGPWRDSRRVLRQEFGPDVVSRYRPVEEKATHELLKNILQAPERVLDHFRHMAGAEIMEIAYGIDVLPNDDPYVLTAEHAVESISETTNAGSYLVDVIPLLRYVPEWVPGARFQKEARIWKKSVMDMLYRPFNVVKERMANGNARECATSSLLDSPMYKEAKDRDYIEDIIRAAVGSMYTGGADTTVSALGSFALAMVLYPEVQVKAQREIDEVCGDRLPSFSDYTTLPYIDAIVKEALRWHPVVPIDVPHRSSADDIYNGYYLPKDTLVVANTWAILHDNEAYPDPLRFNPDRFLKDGKIDLNVRDPMVAAFGFGRRTCPGRFMAYESMWIAIASVLATFNFNKAKDEYGNPITPPEAYVEGFLCYPKPFACSITPRSQEHRALIEAVTE